MITDIEKVQVDLWPTDKVTPYPFNHKKHPEKHIQTLMRSIKVHGHLDPIVVDRLGVIISGHGRFEAIKRLGRSQVAVRCLVDVTDEEASALRIAANKTVSNDYDTDMLSLELGKLKDLSFDLTDLGFDERELTMLMTDVGVIDTDSLVSDMDEAVAKHSEAIDETAAEADEDDVRLDKAFGFKTIPLRDKKVVLRFMAEVQAKTGKEGADALISHMRESIGVA